RQVLLLGRRYKGGSRDPPVRTNARTDPHKPAHVAHRAARTPTLAVLHRSRSRTQGGEMAGSDQSEGAAAPDTVDRIVADLIELRTRAGVVPYAEISRRIGRRRARAANGGPTQVPARSTIYDAFRSGRSRLDAELVAD